jgi:hypothetical protein
MRVRASSLNYRDLMVLKGGGRGPTKLGVVPLSDGAGEVAAIGDGVTRVKVGDRIAGTFHPRWFGGPIRPEYLSRPSRNQTGISNALRPRPYGLFWMVCRFTSARIFPQRGCKLNEPNGFEPLRRIHDRIIRVLWPINFAHKRQRVRS